MPAPRQLVSSAIVLRRVNYDEADRILTLLTPDQGKISAIAKGVRKAKSKMAGGIELFSISEISFIKGKNEIDTLTSTRLEKHFGNIVKELTRSDAGYEFIKLIDKTTEDKPEVDYFNLLAQGFEGLNDTAIDTQITKLWFSLRLLKIAGHAPDLFLDSEGQKLTESKTYVFDIEQMKFYKPQSREGSYDSQQIKFLRLAAHAERPYTLQRVSGAQTLANSTGNLAQAMLSGYVRV